MSKHLKILLEAGVAGDERRPEDARVRVFRLRAESVLAVRAWLDQLQAQRLGNSSLMIFKLDGEPAGQGASHLPWVYVDDIDERYRSACKAGATIVNELASPWGLAMYTVADPEGYRWTFAQARPTMR